MTARRLRAHRPPAAPPPVLGRVGFGKSRDVAHGVLRAHARGEVPLVLGDPEPPGTVSGGRDDADMTEEP